ncbi:helix-turn-helix transcriptional regulator [Plesiomonas shigelloides]|nr:AlpA family phage regulatory protein [Plesiomonas shigelloides]
MYERINPASKRYDATFPKPFKLGLSAIGWLEQDIDAWLKAKTDNCG